MLVSETPEYNVPGAALKRRVDIFQRYLGWRCVWQHHHDRQCGLAQYARRFIGQS